MCINEYKSIFGECIDRKCVLNLPHKKGADHLTPADRPTFLHTACNRPWIKGI